MKIARSDLLGLRPSQPSASVEWVVGEEDLGAVGFRISLKL